jgi:hypothetical protein
MEQNATPNTCSTDDDDLSANNPFRPISNDGLGDQNDMFINCMDYGDWNCYSTFTRGQGNRMVLTLTGPRLSLLASNVCERLAQVRLPPTLRFPTQQSQLKRLLTSQTLQPEHQRTTGPSMVHHFPRTCLRATSSIPLGLT